MRCYPIRYPDGTAFMNDYREDLPNGGLIIPNTLFLSRRERVLLRIELLSMAEMVFIGATVVRKGFSHTRFGKTIRAVELEFWEDEDWARKELLRLARFDLEEFLSRGDDRFAVTWDSELYHSHLAQLARGVVRNISSTGLYIETACLLPRETFVRLSMHCAALQIRQTVQGKVVRVSRDDLSRGLGIRFVFSNPREKKAIERVVQTLAS